MKKKTLITLIVGTIFIIGSGVIVYVKRPIMNLENIELVKNNDTNPVAESENIEETKEEGDTQDENKDSEQVVENKEVVQQKVIDTPVSNNVDEPTSDPAPAPETVATKPSTNPQKNIFSLQIVAQHNSSTNCWTAINGNVYDITSFVSQHPGGVDKISRLCGIDGTAQFTNQHGSTKKAQASLSLLKIGQLN